VQAIEKKLEHITAALAVLLEQPNKEVVSQAGTDDFPMAKLRKMSQRQAVVALARHNGGTIKAQDAKRIMIRAGVMSDTKNSTNMTHNAILQSGEFDRIGRGEFRLKAGTVTPMSSELENVVRMSYSTVKPVQ
ncbi:MAG: hypothetical protein WCC22_18095, partial [Terriglobales bacterium]